MSLQLVHEHYKKDAILGHDQRVEFTENHIKLDVPLPTQGGIISKNGEWKIVSLSPPVVSNIIRPGRLIWFLITQCHVYNIDNKGGG